MKTLIALTAYAFISVSIGLIACGLLLWTKHKRGAAIVSLIFFGGPVFTYIGLYVRDTLQVREFEAAQKEVQQLCAQYGGDKIYKTVENVEGVFQMKARNPDYHGQLADQYGMVEPWAVSAQSDAALGMPTDMLRADIGFDGNGYLFIEQQPEFGKPEGPPYRRTYNVLTGQKVGDLYPDHVEKDKPLTKRIQRTVPRLLSRYGYLTEDLTTKEMRSKWIAGGKIKIIDLQTKEVLAERTGYFLAVGAPNLSAWASTTTGCPQRSGIGSFLHMVLKPVNQSITTYNADLYEKD